MKMSPETKNIDCVLKLDRLVFDRIEFSRSGFKNDHALNLSVNVDIGKNDESEYYRVKLSIRGEKSDEYNFMVQVSGFFRLDGDIPFEKDVLLRKNAVAILMPYLRSEVSLLTAQPEMDCVVLPPFNIDALMDEAENR